MNLLQSCFAKAIGWTISGCNPSKGKRFISSSKCPDSPYGPHSLLFNRYQGLLSQGYNDQDMMLITHPQPGPILRMNGAFLFLSPICLHCMYRVCFTF